MDKNSSYKEIEEKIYKEWEEKGYFKADPNSPKKSFSILMPPPNLTGELHLGHAMQHSVLDAVARFKRMQGFDVLLLPGVDHAGILFEGTLNKILAKEDLSKQKLGREKWLERAWKFKDEVYKSFHATWKVMGISADWSREVFTLDPKVQKAVFTEFKTFWDKNILYKGAYIVQWCPKCGTAIEDVEMEYQKRKEKLYYVKYLIAGTKDQYITVATTRPETIFADVAIATYPNNPEYKNFVGKKAVNPLTHVEIPIIEDKRVDKEFGTGALKITPGHDFLDYEIGKDHNLPILHAVDKAGRLTEIAGKFSGLKASDAREQIGNELSYLNALGWFDNDKKTEVASAIQHEHDVPVCERCKTTVEPLISEEWFVKMKPLAQKALKNINQINFLPKNYLKIISDWLKEIHDWSISRSLWWGHRIPVWYCKICNSNREVGKNKDMVVSQDFPNFSCQTCGKHEWIQDEQVLDTWFSSGLWPISTLNWPDTGREFERYYTWDFELTAPEIKYLWIARMIMLGLYSTDKIPFKNMFFHGMLRDLQGRKFSKSLGNGIDPYALLSQWGVDVTRMTLYSYSVPGRDSKTSKQIMDERCKNFRNFSTKIRNIYRFVIDLKPEKSKKELNTSHPDDKEMIKKLNQVTTDVTRDIEKFNLHLATEKLYNFIWHELADVYIEKSKARREDAQPVLEHILTTCLKLLHPFIPFLTEELYQKMGNKDSIMVSKWPQ